MKAIHVLSFGLWLSIMGLAHGATVIGDRELVMRQVQVKDFTAVYVKGPMTVEIALKETFSVEIAGESNILSKLSVRHDGDAVVFGLDGDFELHEAVRVRITMPNLTALAQLGQVRASIDGVKAKTLDLHLDGDSSVAVIGEVGALRMTALGHTRVNFDHLKVGKAELNISGDNETRFSSVERIYGSAVGHVTVTYETLRASSLSTSAGAKVQKAVSDRR